jgi:hypothetical protein
VSGRSRWREPGAWGDVLGRVVRRHRSDPWCRPDRRLVALARRSRLAPHADRARIRPRVRSTASPRPRGWAGGRVGFTAESRGCADSRPRRGARPLSTSPLLSGAYATACGSVPQRGHRNDTLRSTRSPGRGLSRDRQKRDMRCTDAAHVTILLIFSKFGSNHKRLAFADLTETAEIGALAYGPALVSFRPDRHMLTARDRRLGLSGDLPRCRSHAPGNVRGRT